MPAEEDHSPHVMLAPLLKGYSGRAERCREVSWRFKHLRRPEAELVHYIGSAPRRNGTHRRMDRDEIERTS
jgi:hypothetical protein